LITPRQNLVDKFILSPDNRDTSTLFHFTKKNGETEIIISNIANAFHSNLIEVKFWKIYLVVEIRAHIPLWNASQPRLFRCWSESLVPCSL